MINRQSHAKLNQITKQFHLLNDTKLDVINHKPSCNKLQQAATSCNKLQQAATSCNKLQKASPRLSQHYKPKP